MPTYYSTCPNLEIKIGLNKLLNSEMIKTNIQIVEKRIQDHLVQ